MKRELQIFATFFLIYSIFVHWIGWNETSHFALLRSIAEESRFEINSYANQTGDRVYFKGNYYSDKDLGLSMFSLPAYLIFRNFYSFFDKNKESVTTIAISERPEGSNTSIYTYVNLPQMLRGLIIVAVYSTSVFFGAMLMVLLYKTLKFFSKNEKMILLTTFIIGFGTLIFPYSLLFFNHITSTFLLFFSFYLLFKIKFEKKYTTTYLSLSGIFFVLSFLTSLNFFFLLPFYLFYLSTFIKKKKHYIFLLLLVLVGLTIWFFQEEIFLNEGAFKRSFIDKEVFPILKAKPPLHPVIPGITLPSLNTIFSILFSSYMGLFFFYPVLLFSLLGLIFFKKTFKIETILIILLFFTFLLMNSMMVMWWGGSSFGPRHLTPVIPFLALPLPLVLEKILKKKSISAVFLIFLIFSVFHNLISLNKVEEPVKFKFEKNSESWIIVPNENILYTNYLPIFLKDGPRSRIFEYLLIGEIPDIRDFKPMPVREIKLFTLAPFGILVLKIPFLIIPILLFIIVLIWRKELFKIFIFKRMPIGLLLLILVVLLLLSRLEFKNMVFDKNWHPSYVNATHVIEEKWMAEEASIFLYSPKEEKTNLFFRIGTFYKPRELEIKVNDKILRYRVTSSDETLVTFGVQLKKGENIISLKSLDGCDRPVLLMNESNDYRCLSFIVHGFSLISPLPKFEIIFGKNWYLPEPYITWSYGNSTILIYSAQRVEAKLNLTLISYYKPRQIDFYVNNFLLDTFRIEPYKMNILTKTFTLKEGENIIEFIPKEKCDIPAIIEKSNDDRCLSFGLINAGLISPYELMEENKTFFGPNWYEQEPDGRWMSNNASIFLFSEKERGISLVLELASYYKERKIDLYLNKVLVLSRIIPPYKTEIIVPSLKLLAGENLIEFRSNETCNIPYLIEGSKDKRCLNFKLFDLKII